MDRLAGQQDYTQDQLGQYIVFHGGRHPAGIHRHFRALGDARLLSRPRRDLPRFGMRIRGTAHRAETRRQAGRSAAGHRRRRKEAAVPELLIMRHAKSDWGVGLASDRERPLAKRGVKDAKRMGKVITKMKGSWNWKYSR